MPELRLVVLALQDRLVYEPTYEAALAALFAGTGSSAAGEPPRSSTVTTPSDNVSNGELDPMIKETARDLSDYERLTAEGKLGEAGQKLDDLKRAIERLSNRH